MYYSQSPIQVPIGRTASPQPVRGIMRSRSPVPGAGIVRDRSPAPEAQQGYYGGGGNYGGGGGYGNYPSQPQPQPNYGGYSPQTNSPYNYNANPTTMPRPLSRNGPPSPNISGLPNVGPHSPQIPTSGGFQVEKRAKSPNPYGRQQQPEAQVYRDEILFREQVASLILAKDFQIAVNGRIPVDPAQLVLFFRSKSGVAHSLDFPIDVNYDTPPALDVLITACRPHPPSDYSNYGEREALFYPTNLPLTPSLEIANFPILDAVRQALFPNLQPGQYLTAVMDRLDVVDNGGHLSPQSPAQLKNDNRSATIAVTLPIRYRGGAIVIRDLSGREERFVGSGGKNGDIDWVAFRSDCTYEIEPVQKGVTISILYGVFVKSFGPSSGTTDTLVTPTDRFFDLLSPILNVSRGKTVAFYLSYDYQVNPAEAVANTLVPHLKGGDALLYDAFKFHKLTPELQWTAGGYIWPVDHTLEYFIDDVARPPVPTTRNTRSASPNPYGRNPLHGSQPYGGQGGGDDTDALGRRVQASGAVPLVDANVSLLTDLNNPNPVLGKQRVDFVSEGELTKLVVNTLLTVYIP